MNGNDPRGKDGTGEGSSPDDDLSARLKRLEMQIDRKRPAAAPDPSSRHDRGQPSSLGVAMRLSTEFVAGVLAGGLLGWGCDRLLGTKPWGLIVLLVLGFGAGIYNVMRVSGFFPVADTKKGPPGS
ncbi:ATP synthase protein I [Methylobacterium sp. ap11]|jgi:ATP synthase protein I|uniref:ATP F0F1 synthase subunit I n=1 Tax=Methylobacterium indicum TaxID=1775910 RepID=A0ABR5HAU3_9HYPH|nr:MULTISPECIES: AtpZ/AtpI family protein [Methylobacterium]KMO12579.1 ATP F0F1 synthase subunit I [Methylobacterium indicum]KMO22157.1 ATP F0F1 synthase subunit I [Methylobacterium indicum]SEO70510.1 ATP synthase protein I [Methylobacterium sp. ap11]